MSKPEIIEETPISMFEVKEELNKIKKRDGELGFRGNKTDEYLGMFVKLSSAKSKELFADIEKLKVPRLKPMHINKILDLMPTRLDDLKVLFQAYTITVTQENMKKIGSVVEKYKK